MMENRILESPLFWDALVQYDQNYAIERQQSFPDDPVLGIDERDDFLTRRETDRLHGEALLSLPLSASFLRVIPRAGVRANSYEDTFRSVEYTDNIGTDDSLYREEFDAVDQVAGQVGVELNTRAVAESAGPVGRFDKMRLVVEPNATFDIYDANEDLTEEDPVDTELQGPLAGNLPGIVSLPDGHPAFDANDIPLRDSRVLGARLDTKIQGRTEDSGTLDLLTHSISMAYDFENEEYSDLHSEVFVRPIDALRISNFVAYDLNDSFTREASVGGDLRALSRLVFSAYYSNYRETEDSVRQEFLSGGFEYKLGDKYTLGLSSRYDLDEGEVIRTTARIGRDLHDAVANVLLRYKNATDDRDSEFEVRLVINIPFAAPGSLVGDVF
jgi:lipopolysaccharide assembly outer membrane protein LptD (OstA)